MRDSIFWNVRPSSTGRQLIMFPFLGGFGSSYNRLVTELGGDWDMWAANPPGHGPCMLPPASDLDGLLTHYLAALRDVLKPGAVFFGHSMGSVVAYHLLASMSKNPFFAHRLPSDLVLSGSCAPHQLLVGGYSELPESDLLRHLASFGAIPPEVSEDQSLMDLFVPAFRADYKVLEEAKDVPGSNLAIRTCLVFGDNDPQIFKDTPSAWQGYFALPVTTHVLAGEEHMFVLRDTRALDRILNAL